MHSCYLSIEEVERIQVALAIQGIEEDRLVFLNKLEDRLEDKLEDKLVLREDRLEVVEDRLVLRRW